MNVKKKSFQVFIGNVGLFPKYDLDIKQWLLQQIYFKHLELRVESQPQVTLGEQAAKCTDKHQHKVLCKETKSN